MIVTHDEDRMAGRAFILGPKGFLWRRVHLELAVPYILLSYEIDEGGSWIGKTELYWEVDQLIDACREIASNEKTRMAQIALITPSWMNKCGGWQLRTVHEIWRTQAQSGQPAATMYMTDSAECVTDRLDGDVGAPAIKLLEISDGGVVLTTPRAMST